MKGTPKYLLWGGMLFFLTACPPPCEHTLMDLGYLSEEAIACNPYMDGEDLVLYHSAGQEIRFGVERRREYQSDYGDECMEIRHEKDMCCLDPDYPLFSCYISIDKVDTASFVCIVQAGTSLFIIPDEDDSYADNYRFFDSLKFGNNWYQDVYRIGEIWQEEWSEGQILADSLFYNKAQGILKILMTNGEYYAIED